MAGRILRRGLVCALLTTGVALGAAPAQAVTYDHDDAVGDARTVGLDDEDGSGPFPLARQERAVDITQLRVRHGKSRLIMRLETVDMTRRSIQSLGPAFLIRTPERRFEVDVSAVTYRGETVRYASLSRLPGGDVPCRGLFTDFDFTGDVVLVSIPRSCLDDPRRVTLKAAMVRTAGRTLFSLAGYFDSAMDDGRLRPLSSTPSIASGPRRAV